MNASATWIAHVAKALLFTASFSAWSSTGPRVETFYSPIDDTDQPYALYVPLEFDPAKRYPLVMSLHGAGSNHRLNLRRVFGLGNRPGESDAEATRYFPKFPAVDMIVASPLARGTLGYIGIPEADVYAVMEDVKKRFAIDEDRIYLTGLAMGGGGALYLALTRPDLWAAVAVVCPSMPPGFEPLAGNALHVPIRIYQGAEDPLVRPEAVRAWRDRLRSGGATVEYIEYPGVKHNAWDAAYANAGIFAWFRQHRRVRSPIRVSFTGASFRYPAAYWVQFDSFTPGVFATIDARLSGRNEVLIETQNLDGFTLKLDPATDWKVRVDGRRFVSKSLRFHKRADWQEGPAPPPRKRTGGILEALGARHVYIHAEGDRETAERLAAWSTPRKPLLLTLRSFPENAVTPEDVNGANLVLLPGVKAEGLLAARAPLRLNPGAADYTFLTTAEAPDRQVVLIQGRPPASLAPHPFPPHLNNDYVLLRGEEVLAQGIYTKNWELPPGVRQKLLDTGVIEAAP
jgi:pimeloyl-ACP methyl ester carboxylesterase